MTQIWSSAGDFRLADSPVYLGIFSIILLAAGSLAVFGLALLAAAALRLVRTASERIRVRPEGLPVPRLARRGADHWPAVIARTAVRRVRGPRHRSERR